MLLNLLDWKRCMKTPILSHIIYVNQFILIFILFMFLLDGFDASNLDAKVIVLAAYAAGLIVFINIDCIMKDTWDVSIVLVLFILCILLNMSTSGIKPRFK